MRSNTPWADGPANFQVYMTKWPGGFPGRTRGGSQGCRGGPWRVKEKERKRERERVQVRERDSGSMYVGDLATL